MSYRLAILSDVHADVYALRDALASLARLGCDGIVCAGDLVDYGLFPEETLQLLVERGIACIRGNHDRWAAGAANTWDLSREAMRFLRGLPPVLKRKIEGVRIAVHHGSPRGDMDGIDPERLDASLARTFVEQADCDVLVVGHTHRAFQLELAEGGCIVNPAALLRDPAEGAENPPATATIGVLELPSRKFSVHRAADGIEVTCERRRIE